jgi:hypothetical protein
MNKQVGGGYSFMKYQTFKVSSRGVKLGVKMEASW